MYQPFEIPGVIIADLPELKKDLSFLPQQGYLNKAIEALSAYTHRMIRLNQTGTTEKCMRLAGKLYNRGSIMVRNSIENIFVFSFGSMRACCSAEEWKKISAKMPLSLSSLYVQQIYKSGL